MIDAYTFWKNVDIALAGDTLTSLAKRAGVDYRTLKNQRSLGRLPKLEDAYALAITLNLSIEHLITGKDDAGVCPEALAVQDSMELRSLIRYIQEDSNLLSALQLVIRSAKADPEKVAN